ncbi:MAG: hypothetical protein ACKOWO_09585 [Sediminibacterium sp.]
MAKAQFVKDKITRLVAENPNIQHIQLISNKGLKIDSLPKIDCSTGEIEVLSHKREVWALVNGTSRVFKLGKDGLVDRMDNTCYQGFNFGATNISYKDTLYSLGGYGFWQTTGSIRFLNETTREWDIVRGINDVPFAAGINALTYYDQKNAKLFVIYSPSKPEYVKNDGKQSKNLLIQCFDFKLKQWWNEAKIINPLLANKISDLYLIQKFGSKILFSSSLNGKILLMNLNENKIEEVDDKYSTELIQLKGNKTEYISYTIGDTVHIYDLIKDTIITSYIPSNKLTPYSESIYSEASTVEAINKISWLVISLLVNGILVIGFILLLIRNNKNKTETAATNHLAIADSAEKEGRKIKDYINNLTIIEKEIIELLIKNGLEGQNTTVTQLNKILGTEKKTFKIQNNIRGEALSLINQKFMAFASVNNNLIERQRSEYDKRHVEYFISDKYFKKFTLKMFEKAK